MQDPRPPLFTHELAVSREQSGEVLQGFLHTILFTRLLGALEPTTKEVFGVELPYVRDSAMEKRITDTITEILTCLDKNAGKKACTNLDVVISWHRPEHLDALPKSRPPKQDARQASNPIFHSPYSWLASAISGGRSGGRDALDRTILTCEDSGDSISSIFEQWLLSLQIVYHSEQQDNDPDLTSFLLSALSFANKHQTRLPPVGDACLAPFPFSIESSMRH
ncbi:hypothetical protein MYAM1_002997 [Malassezia yamatoensis]|uniref:Autophagy-related protein 101 n=1 Tax=Malassezia yamatoensis TaxID=253288 RepID=A0AAJ5YT60_9BASI|nr:hypothetical protein MYAM1_002997 [Malassezia yamatoensis]